MFESQLYIDEDGDGLDADQERQLGTSDYLVDTVGDGISDYDKCFGVEISTNNPGSESSTNSPGGGHDDSSPGGGNDDSKDNDKDAKGVIYVDQANGNDTFTGRAPHISAKTGPKKTIRGGLSIASPTNDTIVIKSGNYHENLNIQGKNVKVFIEGNVRL